MELCYEYNKGKQGIDIEHIENTYKGTQMATSIEDIAIEAKNPNDVTCQKKTIKRNPYLDFVKGVAIYLVVLGHSIQTFDQGYKDNKVFLCIYMFHMPLFMALSGYLFHVNSGNIWDNLKKKFKRLYVPSLIVGGAIMLPYAIFKLVTNSDLDYVYVINVLFAGAWFLTVLFLLSMIGILMGTYLKRWSIAGWVLLSIILYFIPGYWMINELKFLSPFFLLGMSLQGFDSKRLNKNYKLLLFIISSIVFLLCFSIFSFDYTMYEMSDDTLSLDFLTKYVVRFLSGVSGCIIMLLLCSLCKDYGRVIKVLIYCGTITLPIYVLHPFILMANRIANLQTDNILLLVLSSIIILGLSILVYRSTRNMRCFKLLYGEV